jgi:hypothetical protein
MSKKHPILGRELDPQWQHGRRLINHGLFKPTFRQRVAIMFGMNVVFTVNTFTQHNPGRTASGVFPRITSATDPNDKRLDLLLKIEDQRALLAALPSAEQFEAAEQMKEAWEKLQKEYEQKEEDKG